MGSRVSRNVPGVIAGVLLLGALAWPFLQLGETPQHSLEPTPTSPTPDAQNPSEPVAPTVEPPDEVKPRVPSRVTLDGGRLFVDGAPAPIIRCVGYQPVPVGVNPAHGYRWAHFPENYDRDLPLLRDLGVNTVAVNTRAAATPSDLLAFMDGAHVHGIRVILVVDGPNRENATDPLVQASLLENATLAAEAYRNHPALLAWQVGIEVDYSYRDDGIVGAWYALLENVTRELHALDPNHLVLTANNPITPEEAFLEGSPSVDIYGINFYGLTREGTSGYVTNLSREVPGYPVFVTEFGVDAHDNLTGAEDQETQARVLAAAWSGIQDAHDAGAPVLGGCVHEWSDQWWKGGASDSHDPFPVWPAPDSGVLPDETMSEEWFGLVKLVPGSTERELRASYYRLRDLWAAP